MNPFTQLAIWAENAKNNGNRGVGVRYDGNAVFLIMGDGVKSRIADANFIGLALIGAATSHVQPKWINLPWAFQRLQDQHGISVRAIDRWMIQHQGLINRMLINLGFESDRMGTYTLFNLIDVQFRDHSDGDFELALMVFQGLADLYDQNQS